MQIGSYTGQKIIYSKFWWLKQLKTICKSTFRITISGYFGGKFLTLEGQKFNKKFDASPRKILFQCLSGLVIQVQNSQN